MKQKKKSGGDRRSSKSLPVNRGAVYKKSNQLISAHNTCKSNVPLIKKHLYNLRKNSSVICLENTPSPTSDCKRKKYSELDLKSALFVTKDTHPTKKTQSHISVITISSTDDDPVEEIDRDLLASEVMSVEESGHCQLDKLTCDVSRKNKETIYDHQLQFGAHQLGCLNSDINNEEPKINQCLDEESLVRQPTKLSIEKTNSEAEYTHSFEGSSVISQSDTFTIGKTNQETRKLQDSEDKLGVCNGDILVHDTKHKTSHLQNQKGLSNPPNPSKPTFKPLCVSTPEMKQSTECEEHEASVSVSSLAIASTSDFPTNVITNPGITETLVESHCVSEANKPIYFGPQAESGSELSSSCNAWTSAFINKIRGIPFLIQNTSPTNTTIQTNVAEANNGESEITVSDSELSDSF